MPLPENWALVIRAALDEYLDKKTGGKPSGIPAAPFKALLIRQAEAVGLNFPPPGYENLKFSEFLSLFPSIVQIHRRPGQDVLLIRTGDLEILSDPTQIDVDQPLEKRERTAFRPDIFKAFTKISPSGHCFWYSRDSDKFIEGTTATLESSLIKVPPNTLEDSISDRRDFAETVADPRKNGPLINSLNDPLNALGAFSQVIKEQHLEREWHIFRFRRLESRIRDWCSTAEVDWSPTWTGISKPTNQALGTVTSREINSFLAGLMQLGPDDAKRVMVPLDIVLKLMRRD